MPNYILHRYKGAHHNVSIDVLSDYHVHWLPYYTLHMNMEDDTYIGIHVLTDWMPYYTHQEYKGTNHYVCVDGLSDCSYHWMPYYTHHKYKGAHHYVCVDVLSIGYVE